MAPPILIVVAVRPEADAVGALPGTVVVESGIGRTNAAAATTEALLRRGPFRAVLSAGIAGALQNSGLAIGDAVVAEMCVYGEEGILTPDGFHDVRALGFPLGDFVGNEVPVDPDLLARLSPVVRPARIATVATCSGTNELEAEV